MKIINKIISIVDAIKTKFSHRKKAKELDSIAEWIVEYDGIEVGELVEKEWKGYQFWFRYKLIPYKEFEAIVLDEENWNQCKFKYRNKHDSRYAAYAIPGGDFVQKEGDQFFIFMRGLS